jgi:hypothetical protein
VSPRPPGPRSATAVDLRSRWAAREERIFELENLLDEEDIEEADRVVIQDQLRRLSDAELIEKDERQAWSVIGRRARGGPHEPVSSPRSRGPCHCSGSPPAEHLMWHLSMYGLRSVRSFRGGPAIAPPTPRKPNPSLGPRVHTHVVID